MTLEDVKAMSDEEICVAVAKTLGWTEIQDNGSWIRGRERQNSAWGKPVPVYAKSLDACFEMEKVLNLNQAWEYNRYLQELQGTAAGIGSGVVEEWSWHATSRQKCEAFILTMESAVCSSETLS